MTFCLSAVDVVQDAFFIFKSLLMQKKKKKLPSASGNYAKRAMREAKQYNL